jgi:hypothetical protein
MRLPRHAEIWLAPYVCDRARCFLAPRKPKRAWIAITDHYEPLGNSSSLQQAISRVRLWQDRWPLIADDAPRDAAGRRPQYSFFYPQEEYRHELLDGLSEIAGYGIGEVEIHIHHDHETAEAFVSKMTQFSHRLFYGHGLLRQHDGVIRFGFIHGNWALDNSRPDGRWCGLQGEIALLRDLGCYADFTMPSLPSPTQGKVLNKIYWCTSDVHRSKCFDHGTEVGVDCGVQGDLMMITGPIGLRYRQRVIPRIETGEIAAYDPPTRYRVRRWFDLAPQIGDDLFLKLYTHGAQERNCAMLLDGGLRDLFRWCQEEAADRQIELRWASAWDMFLAIEALAQGRRSMLDVRETSATQGAF